MHRSLRPLPFSRYSARRYIQENDNIQSKKPPYYRKERVSDNKDQLFKSRQTVNIFLQARERFGDEVIKLCALLQEIQLLGILSLHHIRLQPATNR